MNKDRYDREPERMPGLAVGNKIGTPVELNACQSSVEVIGDPAPEPDTWSDELRAQTRAVIESGGPIGTPDGNLGLKHISGGFGVITETNLVWAVFKVVDRKTNEVIAKFGSVDELIAAGWAID